MNQQSTGPAREFVAVEKLTGGEHVNHQADQFANVMTWQVGHFAPYTDENSVPMVALTLTPVGGGEPALIRERRGVTLPLATDAEVAAAEADGTRATFANALVEMAQRILNDRLPVPTYVVTLRGCLDSREDLERWIAAFDGSIEMSGRIPVARGCRMGGADGIALEIELQGPTELDAQAGE